MEATVETTADTRKRVTAAPSGSRLAAAFALSGSAAIHARNPIPRKRASSPAAEIPHRMSAPVARSSVFGNSKMLVVPRKKTAGTSAIRA